MKLTRIGAFMWGMCAGVAICAAILVFTLYGGA